MNSLAELTSRPIALKVEVKDDRGEPTGEILEYLIHPLNFADHGGLQRWIDSQFPDPYETAWAAIERRRESGNPFNVAQEQFILKNAQEQALRPRNLIGTPEADRLLTSAEGLRRIIVEGIRKGDPSFDEAAADRLIAHMSQADLYRAYAGTQMNLVISDPKAEPLDVMPRSKPTGGGVSRRTRRAAKVHRNGGKSGMDS
jgi:hypothetical protein